MNIIRHNVPKHLSSSRILFSCRSLVVSEVIYVGKKYFYSSRSNLFLKFADNTILYLIQIAEEEECVILYMHLKMYPVSLVGEHHPSDCQSGHHQ